MHRHLGRWLGVVVVAIGLARGGPGAPLLAADPPPPIRPSPAPSQSTDPSTINIFLGAANDLDALWKRLDRPDFVLLSGEEYARLRELVRDSREKERAPWSALVEAVLVRGVVRDELARLEVDFQIHLANDGPAWANLRLDHLPLISAREGDRDLPIRTGDGSARLTEVKGQGRHTVRVQTVVPVRSISDGRRLDLAIPETASTRFQIDVPRRVGSAECDPGEPLNPAPSGTAGLTRLAADVSPRASLSLTWRVDDDPATALPALLVAKGEIAVDIEPGSFRTRSSWSIRSIRGTARNLQLALDPADEVLELELDGQPPPAGMERSAGSTRLTIPLTESLGPGQERRLVLSTRRPIAPGPRARVSLHGFPLTNAREQTGAIGIAQGEGLWVSGVASRGARQIDPRTELPAELRARPATTLAYQFSEQPFELDLNVETSPPLVRSEGRHTLTVEPGLIHVDSWLDFQATRGRLFELLVDLPAGLELDTVGPDDVVGSWQTSAVPATAGARDGSGGKLLSLRLLPRVQDGKFSVHLASRQRLAPGQDVRAVLPRSVNAQVGGGRVVIVSDPALSVESPEPIDGASGWRPMIQGPPPDWPWPSGRPASTGQVLALRYDEFPENLPLRVTAHRRTFAQDTLLSAHVSPDSLDVVQDSEFTLRFGSTDHVDIAIPAPLVGRWDIESPGVRSRTELRDGSRGARIVRLGLGAVLNRSIALRFRFKLDRAKGAGPIEQEIPWIAFPDVQDRDSTLRFHLDPDPTLAVSLAGPGWQLVSDSDHVSPLATGAGSANRPGLHALRTNPEAPLRLLLNERRRLDLPDVVVSRMGLETTQTPDGHLRTSAWLALASRAESLSLILPKGAEVERVAAEGVAIENLEGREVATGYVVQIPLRAGDRASRLVQVQYVQRQVSARSPWVPPIVDRHAVVQESVWAVRIPWSWALVGIPPDWVDANEWYWDWYVWKRRPQRGLRNLAEWTGGPGSQTLGDGESMAVDYHSYAFSRPGEPARLAPWVVARAWLVTVASGLVLLLGGVLFLAWRPSLPLAWCAVALFGLTAATLWHPSVVFLAIQSASVGFGLTALLVLIQSIVNRRSQGLSSRSASAGRTPLPMGPTFNHVVGVNADDSTAVRARPVAVSTLDFVPAVVESVPQAPGSSAMSNREVLGLGPETRGDAP